MIIRALLPRRALAQAQRFTLPRGILPAAQLGETGRFGCAADRRERVEREQLELAGGLAAAQRLARDEHAVAAGYPAGELGIADVRRGARRWQDVQGPAFRVLPEDPQLAPAVGGLDREGERGAFAIHR